MDHRSSHGSSGAERLPIVAVIGSGNNAHEALAEGLGPMLASVGVHLICGGGGGVMASVSRAFYLTRPRRGSVIGVLPSIENDRQCHPKEGYPNDWVEIPIATHLFRSGRQGCDPLSRNHIIILSSDAVIALPGGDGTRSEISLALRYQRPILAYFEEGETVDKLPACVQLARDQKDVKRFLFENLRMSR